MNPNVVQEGWDVDWKRNLLKNRRKMGKTGLRSWDFTSRVEPQRGPGGLGADWKRNLPQNRGKLGQNGLKVGIWSRWLNLNAARRAGMQIGGKSAPK